MIKMICNNCMDFDRKQNICTIRYILHKDKSKSPMPRKATQRGCEVFLLDPNISKNNINLFGE